MDNNINVFEFATRKKIRFGSSRGELTIEQLWDVPLRSKDGFNLDAVAQGVNNTLKAISVESFVPSERKPSTEVVKFEAALEVVKHVIAVKVAEEEAAERRAANRVERERLLAILAEKQTGRLSELSERELQKRIAALET